MLSAERVTQRNDRYIYLKKGNTSQIRTVQNMKYLTDGWISGERIDRIVQKRFNLGSYEYFSKHILFLGALKSVLFAIVIL